MTLPGDPEGAAQRPVGDMTTGVYRVPAEGEAESVGEEAVSPEGLTAGSALLVVKRGPTAGSRYLLEEATVTAGRHPDSDIFLDDVTVSRRHARVTTQGAGHYLIEDVGSLNGTYVDGDRVDSLALREGAQIQIGKFRLVFVIGTLGGHA
jgi:pSer/pThr/pTyr-binding forkhead associated (FHA) protein